MARLGFGTSKVSPKFTEQTPSEKVSQALDVFTQAQTNLSTVLSDLNSEKEILQAQLQEVSQSADRAEAVLKKIGNLLD